MTQTTDTSKLHLGDIEVVAQQKYLDYAMSVIIARALPDVRDGLKPVHRRILYAMHTLKSSSNGAYKKSARIVGDVIGKYHPHGDTSVYDAMVRLTQPFSMRILLVDGQGNFGSVDGDNAAAMRYTEARFHKFSESMFDDINLNTVDMQPNYDGTETEPSVLPILYPNIIINGGEGIAVGMASKIPPHNPIEVMNAVKYLVQCRKDNVEPNIDVLIDLVPAPDFPTKGLIHGTHSMKEVWESGRGSMKLRARWREEVIDNRNVIVVYELPYQINKEKLKGEITKLSLPISDKDNINFGNSAVEGIYEVTDESDKTGHRLCIYLKHGYDAEVIFNKLLKLTDLEININYNATVIVNGEPKLIGFEKIIGHFIDHREEIILRRTNTLYEKNLAREEILTALMKAVHPDNLDNVINIVRNNKEVKDAREQIITLLEINEIQATAVLELSLKRLTGLEIESMNQELQERKEQNIEYRNILNNQSRRYEIIIEESDKQIEIFESTKESFDKYWTTTPYQGRLTEIHHELMKTDIASITKKEESVIFYTHDGYIRRCPIEELKEQNRGTRGYRKIDMKNNDYIINTFDVHSHDAIMFITEKGQAFTIFAYEVATNQSGRHINNLLPNKKESDKIAKIIPIDFNSEQELTLITQSGMVKRGPVRDYKNSQSFKAGIRVMKIGDDDKIFDAHITNNNTDLMFFKADNSVSRTDINNFTIKKGRVTSGVKGTKLNSDLVGVIAIDKNDEKGIVATVTSNGIIKLSYTKEYRQTSRHSKGVKALKSSEKTGDLVNAVYINNINKDIIISTKKGIVNRMSLSEFRVSSRVSSGFKLIGLDKNDEIVSVFIVDSEEDIEE